MTRAHDDSRAPVSTGAEQIRQAAASVWRRRHRFEVDAAERFARLGATLRSLGGDAELADMLEHAAEDERRHARQFAELVHHFGGAPPPAAYPAAAAAAPAGLSPQDALSYELVAMACITETLSCALLGEMCDAAKDGSTEVHNIMRAILRDEVAHSRVGWAYLQQQGGDVPHALLARALPAMLAATVPDALFGEAAATPLEASLSGLGALSRAERLRIFAGSMRQVVFPGLRHFGIDAGAGEAWLASRTGGS